VEKGIFSFTLRYSRTQQIVLLAMIFGSFPFLYYSLDLPKQIVNEAIGGSGFPKPLLGIQFSQLQYLAILSGLFLAMVLVNGAFKYVISVYTGVMAERLLRRLRFMLLHRIIRFPLPHFRKVSQGEMVAMVTTESEALGGFVGDAFSVPAFQGGVLITTLFFIAKQDPMMGLAAIALYPMQAYIIPRLQRRVNQLGKQRVRHVRKLSERIGELVSGAPDIHANDTSRYELAAFSDQLGEIYDVRFDIYNKKFFIKFLNNFLNQLTPFFFYSIGGFLVIQGNLSFGALVAVLAAYKDLSAPWKELLTWYQTMMDTKVKYDQLVEQFELPTLMDETLLIDGQEDPPLLEGPLTATNLQLADDDGGRVLDGISFTMPLDCHGAIIGPGGSGKGDLARLLARQFLPTGGRLTVGSTDLASLPEAVTGRRIGYVDAEAYIRAGTIRDNLIYGIRNYPRHGNDGVPADRLKRLEENLAAGNSPFDITADWIDTEALGYGDRDGLVQAGVAALKLVRLEEDIFNAGLRSPVNPERHPALADKLLTIRTAFRERLDDPAIAGLVEVFDRERFNQNASIAENILFGTPLDERLRQEHIAEQAYVMHILDAAGLRERFLRVGHDIAGLMLEIFRDLPPGHEFFERYSFIDHEDLPDFQRMLGVVRQSGFAALAAPDRARLISLTFRMVPARHRLGLVDEAMEQDILKARRLFAERLPDDLKDAVAFFEVDRFKADASISDNILFGKVDSLRPDAGMRISAALRDLIQSEGVYEEVLQVGLEMETGIAGKRLTVEQRQKLALARAILKRPQLLIVNEALSALEPALREAILADLDETMQGRGLLWIDSALPENISFDLVIRMDNGRIAGIERSGEMMATEPAAQPQEAGDRPQRPSTALGREVEVLSAIPFFKGMDASRLKLLAFAAERRVFQPGEIIVRQGEKGDRAYVVLDGSVDIILQSDQGIQTIATRVGRELIGELALLTEAPRTATIRAREKVEAMVITSELFFKLIQENAAVTLNLTHILAKRLTDTLRVNH
jgi:ABC-type multidrug transport system fused ATPase/permease subunit